MQRSQSAGDIIFTILIYAFLVFSLLIVLYPLLFVVSASISEPRAVMSGKVWLLPVNPTFMGYQAVFKNPNILTGFANTLFYTVVGTAVNILLTVLAAYPLSLKEFRIRKHIMSLLVFTMLFSGGLIPSYMLVRNLGMVNTRWAMIIPAAMSVWNVILTRTYFQTTIPEQLRESAKLDGCDDFRYLYKILVPLSGPIIAVVSLYYAVDHWNTYFDALIYLQSGKLYPLQIILRDILILNSVKAEMTIEVDKLARTLGLMSVVKYALIVVASVPILVLYPFIQKYFIKGVMVGSLKG